MKKFALGLLVFIILLVVGISFVTNTGKKVATSWSEGDFASGLEKSQILIDDIELINLTSLTTNNFNTVGTNNIDSSFTQEEMSGLISMANDAAGPIKDVKVSFDENGRGEVSFNISENFTDFVKEQGLVISFDPLNVYASDLPTDLTKNSDEESLTDLVVNYIMSKADNKPVYATGTLTRASDNSVNINIDSLSVGLIPLPQETIDIVEYHTLEVVNSIISPENGFHIEELQVHNGELYYRGTLPAEIKGVEL